MSNGEKQTGISDGVYNPTSLVFHAAEGGTPHAKYTQYAGQEGDDELADFLRQVQQNAQCARQARSLLDNR